MSILNLTQFQKYLLKWYRNEARDLPWRRTSDPYQIWVSEIMLQQTQVDTVIPYYEKWLRRFPTVEKLAKAPQSEALKYWAGLGYYRRARMLHAGAQTIVADFKGKLPQKPDELQKIPGIGRYTAGAIASIAFEAKAPILDGNVIRILTRILAISSDIGSTQTIKKLWEISEVILPNKNLGDFNQALMELGATVCTPDNPSCQKCPVQKFCKAYAKKTPEKYPVKKQKIKLEKKTTAALIIQRDKRVFIEKQPASGRWGGLWMFPHWDNKKLMMKDLDKRSMSKPLMTIKHGFTKYQIDLEVFQWLHPLSKTRKGSWVEIPQLKKYAFPSPHQKIVRKLVAGD